MDSVALLTSEEFLNNEIINVHTYRYNMSDIELHQHQFIEIEYIITSGGTHVINGERYNIRQGDLLFIPRGITHSIFPNNDDINSHLMVYNIIFGPDILEKYRTIPEIESIYSNICTQFDYSKRINSGFLAENYIYHLPEQVAIKALVESMCFEYNSKYSSYKDILELQLIQLLIFLQRDNVKTKRTSTVDNIIENSVHYIKENCHQPLKVDELSSRVFLSKNYFSSIFKKRTGSTVVDYIQQARVEKACELLTTTNLPINRVIEQVGYTDYRFFNTVFKRTTGYTALKYRHIHTTNE